MGLFSLPLHNWIEVDRYINAHLSIKRHLLETRHEDVFKVLPESDAPSSELLTSLGDHLPRYHSSQFDRADDTIINNVTGETWELQTPSLHPLEVVGRLVQEDICVLTRRGDEEIYRLVGGVLCFPANWRLSEKIGCSILEVHEPVPGYAEKLAAPVNRFMQMLQPDKLVWRYNWLLLDDPALFQQDRLPMTGHITPENAGDTLWLRAERQTLRRLPLTKAIIFAIRTHVTPLSKAIVKKQHALALADTIRDMPSETLNYRHMAPIVPSLLGWLDAAYHRLQE
jgi:hypothetical protein